MKRIAIKFGVEVWFVLGIMYIKKIYPAVKKIYDDGAVILEDGSTL